MKPGSMKTAYVLIAFLLLGGFTLALVSWDRKHDQNDQPFKQDYTDTPKKKNNNVREKKVRDLDEALQELENVDMSEISADVQKEIAEAMKSFNAEKIQQEINAALKSVDMEKIMKEVKEAMKSVNMEEIQREIKEAMKEVDAAKLQLEVSEAMKNVDMAKVQKEVAEAMKNVDAAKLQKEISESMSKVDMEKIMAEMAGAKVGIEKAKAELKEYKEFVDGLEKDGLINKKENYTIEHKDGELTINGKKASQQTYNKYRTFLEKHKSFKMQKDEDDFDFDHDNDNDDNEQ